MTEETKRLTWKEFFAAIVTTLPVLFVGFFVLIGLIVGIAAGYQYVFTDSPTTADQLLSRLRSTAFGALALAVCWGLYGWIRVLLDPEESPWRKRRSRRQRRRVSQSGQRNQHAEPHHDGRAAGPELSAAGLPCLPRPEKWRGRSRRIALVAALLALAVTMTAGGIALLQGGKDPLGGAFLLTVAVLLLGIVTLGSSTLVFRPRRGSISLTLTAPGARTRETATSIPFSRAVVIARTSFAVVYGITGAALMVMGALGASLVLLGLGVTFLALFGWAVIGVARRRVAPGRLLLTPSGVVNYSWGSGAAVSWDAVIGVTAMEIDRAPYALLVVNDPEAATTWRTAGGTHAYEQAAAPHVPLALQPLAGDPALIFHAVRYYHEHPAARSELGGSAAETRIRRGDVLN